jgi:hypothetical protein
MEIIDNPLLSKAHRSGRTPPSNSSSVVPFERPKRRVSAKTERLIGELGLRYRPSREADLDEHAAALALLTTDVADVPPDLLEDAIRRHVMGSPYMPKASELIAIAQSLLTNAQPKAGTADLPGLAARYNARLAAEGRRDIEWVAEGGDIHLRAR